MTERPAGAVQPPASSSMPGDAPSPEIAAFIRYCHGRRQAGWPELYDEMCAVAARREYRGWDHEQLAARGVTFSLFDMQRLAAWVRNVLAASAPRHATAPTPPNRGASTPRPQPHAVVA